MFKHRHRQGYRCCRVSGGDEFECKNAEAGPSSECPSKKKEQQGSPPTAEGLVW